MSVFSGSKTTASPWKNPNWVSTRILENGQQLAGRGSAVLHRIWG
jgi:hypothetical protein